jgi:dipeptidyl aminopeptidase/acylaminoacyl peptidase
VPEPRVSAALCAYARGIAEPALSADGRRLAYISTVNGRASLAVIDVATGVERVVTTEPVPRSAAAYGGGVFSWLPDSSGFVHSTGEGDLWLVSLGGDAPRQLTRQPSSRPAGAPAVSPDGRRVAFVVDQRDVAVMELDANGGWATKLSRDNDFALDPVWSADGQFVAWHEWDVPNMSWDESRWALAPSDGSGVVITRAEPGAQLQQPRFAPVGTDLSYLCDSSGWLNLWVLGPNCDPELPVVKEPFEHGYSAWSYGQRSTAWSPDGRRIAFTRNEGGFGRLCVVDLESGAVQAIGKGVHSALSWQGSSLAALRSGAVTPTELVVYDTTSWERRTLAYTAPAGFEGTSSEPEPVTWEGTDGEQVHGLLYRPAEPARTPPPLLVWIHGGPTGQWQVDWKARLPFFLDRGWAVLAVNHRGSTGYGRAYAQAMRGLWGVMDVADTAAGMRSAAEQGWGHPRGMVPIGGSAGGFTVLNLLAHHPDLCAAGVAVSAVADLFELDEKSHRFEAHYNHSLVGALPGAAPLYRERAPITVADRIRGPLLLLHGTDDPVVPVEQSTRLAEAAGRAGAVVEHHLYEGEGHGWGKPATVIDELERTNDFLRRHVLRWLA